MELTQITDAPMREEEIEYATIEVMPEEESNQPKAPQQQQENLVAVPLKDYKPMHQLIKERFRLSKRLTKKSATIANLRVLKDEQRYHQRKARKLGKLIATMVKDLDVLAESESEDEDSSSEDDQDIKMVDVRAANPDNNK